MFVCMCAAVTDSEIHACVHAGARTIDEVAEHSLAGTGCGGCRDHIQEILSGGRIVAMRSRVFELPRSA
jgi:bacterioferritin-associated ferredoxin